MKNPEDEPICTSEQGFVQNKHDNQNSIVNDQEPLNESLVANNQFNTFDDIFKILGEFGRYQKLLYFMFSITYVMTAMQLLGWVFIGAKTPVRCLYPFEVNQTKRAVFSDVMTNLTSSCSYTWNGHNFSSCELGFVYDTSSVKYSAVMNWDLVCENEGLCLI